MVLQILFLEQGLWVGEFARTLSHFEIKAVLWKVPTPYFWANSYIESKLTLKSTHPGVSFSWASYEGPSLIAGLDCGLDWWTGLLDWITVSNQTVMSSLHMQSHMLSLTSFFLESSPAIQSSDPVQRSSPQSSPAIRDDQYFRVLKTITALACLVALMIWHSSYRA